MPPNTDLLNGFLLATINKFNETKKHGFTQKMS